MSTDPPPPRRPSRASRTPASGCATSATSPTTAGDDRLPPVARQAGLLEGRQGSADPVAQSGAAPRRSAHAERTHGDQATRANQGPLRVGLRQAAALHADAPRQDRAGRRGRPRHLRGGRPDRRPGQRVLLRALPRRAPAPRGDHVAGPGRPPHRRGGPGRRGARGGLPRAARRVPGLGARGRHVRRGADAPSSSSPRTTPATSRRPSSAAASTCSSTTRAPSASSRSSAPRTPGSRTRWPSSSWGSCAGCASWSCARPEHLRDDRLGPHPRRPRGDGAVGAGARRDPQRRDEVRARPRARDPRAARLVDPNQTVPAERGPRPRARARSRPRARDDDPGGADGRDGPDGREVRAGKDQPGRHDEGVLRLAERGPAEPRKVSSSQGQRSFRTGGARRRPV